jgi:ribosomal-protein-serine acetyltransferase
MFSYTIDDALQLALVTQQDVPAIFELTDRSREHLRVWLPWVDDTTSIQDTLGFVSQAMTQYAKNNGFQAVIWEDGSPAGIIGLHGIDWANRYTIIGYWLGESFQGRGIMTRAVRGVTTFLYEHYGLNRVEIRAATGNAKSRAIPERLGYSLEGISRQCERLHDHYVDHAVYAMLRENWPTSNA